MENTASPATIQRALRLLEYQRRASRAYYLRHIDEVKRRSTAYWEANRDAINARRRLRYKAARGVIPDAENSPQPQ